MRGKKKILLTAGCVIIVLLLLCIGVLCYGGKREIDQKILFIYRFYDIDEAKYCKNSGYFIDNQGNQVEYDFSKQLDSWTGMYDDELLETLEGMEYTESKPLFSAKETRKLYNWLY
ncbi:MAG: hypothetical protein NC081_10220, partial [Roseburia sp.]|nr:hypothetical protein [Roseburia sp.]